MKDHVSITGHLKNFRNSKQLNTLLSFHIIPDFHEIKPKPSITDVKQLSLFVPLLF